MSAVGFGSMAISLRIKKDGCFVHFRFGEESQEKAGQGYRGDRLHILGLLYTIRVKSKSTGSDRAMEFQCLSW